MTIKNRMARLEQLVPASSSAEGSKAELIRRIEALAQQTAPEELTPDQEEAERARVDAAWQVRFGVPFSAGH